MDLTQDFYYSCEYQTNKALRNFGFEGTFNFKKKLEFKLLQFEKV